MSLPFFIQQAIEFSYKRKMTAGKKITPEYHRKDIELSHIVGQATGAEHILATVLKCKQDPNFNVEDLEAAIHVFIAESLSYVNKQCGKEQAFSIDTVLKVHGYLDENKDENGKST